MQQAKHRHVGANPSCPLWSLARYKPVSSWGSVHCVSHGAAALLVCCWAASLAKMLIASFLTLPAHHRGPQVLFKTLLLQVPLCGQCPPRHPSTGWGQMLQPVRHSPTCE